MLYGDLTELKTMLDIPSADPTEDKKLLALIEQASSAIEDYLGRPGLAFKARTEYYRGSNTPRLTLRHRPVYTTPTITVNIDECGFFGSAAGGFDSTNAW